MLFINMKNETNEVVILKPKELSQEENKISECKYNKIWKCSHPKQWGIKCVKMCEYYESLFEFIQKK